MFAAGSAVNKSPGLGRGTRLAHGNGVVELNPAGGEPRCVMAAIDISSSSRRVLLHGARLARLFSTRLKVLHVGVEVSVVVRRRVLDFCARQGPDEVDICDDDIVLRAGIVSDAIYREATKQKARLVVMGSRGRGKPAVFVLGSTAEAVLRNAPAPVLLVPPGDLDIEDLADHALTIARHGDIAEQISRGAVAERAGLVVIGLRPKSRRQPGAIATAVLRNNTAFVLAVPEAAS